MNSLVCFIDDVLFYVMAIIIIGQGRSMIYKGKKKRVSKIRDELEIMRKQVRRRGQLIRPHGL